MFWLNIVVLLPLHEQRKSDIICLKVDLTEGGNI